MTQIRDRLAEIFELPDYGSRIAAAKDRRRLAEANLETAKANLVAATEPDNLRFAGHRDTPAVTAARAELASAERELIDARAGYVAQVKACQDSYFAETLHRLKQAAPLLADIAAGLDEIAEGLGGWHAATTQLGFEPLLVMRDVPKIQAGARALNAIVDRASGD